MHKLHVHVCPILCQTSNFLKFTKNDRRKNEKNKTKNDRPYFVTNCSSNEYTVNIHRRISLSHFSRLQEISFLKIRIW